MMNFDFQYQQIAENTLEVVELGEKVQVFLLRKYPDSMMMSTYIIFAVGRILITGDLSPGRYGSVSCCGYGIGWFGSEKGPRYLAEKFLDKCYESERAQDDARQYIKEYATWAWEDRDRDEIRRLRKFRDLINESDWIFDNGYELYEALNRFDANMIDDGLPFGYDYPTGDFCWLAAIQKRFAETYQEWLETEAGQKFLKE